MSSECEKLRMEVEEIREKKEQELDAEKNRMDDEYRKKLRALKQEA
jgi:hypothetical protein